MADRLPPLLLPRLIAHPRIRQLVELAAARPGRFVDVALICAAIYRRDLAAIRREDVRESQVNTARRLVLRARRYLTLITGDRGWFEYDRTAGGWHMLPVEPAARVRARPAPFHAPAATEVRA